MVRKKIANDTQKHNINTTPINIIQQVKAQIVAALKAMTHNLSYGDKVSQLLNSNQIWAEFRDQKHDLFITDTNVRGYLTGNRKFTNCLRIQHRS